MPVFSSEMKGQGSMYLNIFMHLTLEMLNFQIRLQYQNLGNIFTGLMLHLSFKIISDVYKSFIPNKSTLTTIVLLSRFQRSPGGLKSTE